MEKHPKYVSIFGEEVEFCYEKDFFGIDNEEVLC